MERENKLLREQVGTHRSPSNIELVPWADGSRETSNKNKEALQDNNRNRNSWALSMSRQSVRVLGVVC